MGEMERLLFLRISYSDFFSTSLYSLPKAGERQKGGLGQGLMSIAVGALKGPLLQSPG